jgi:predicted N-acetyltransferase YhbS
MALRIRRFRPEDARACSRIIRQNHCRFAAFEDGLETAKKLSRGNSPKALLKKSNRRTFFVAVQEERIVGLAGYEKNEVKTVFVDLKMHGQGVGSKLLKHILAVLARQGKRKIVLMSSVVAEDFYKKFGFRRVRKKTIDWEGVPLTYVDMVRWGAEKERT